MKIWILFLGTILDFMYVNAQYIEKDISAPLNIGDKLPAMEFSLHALDSSWTTNMNEFKGKAILLNYWGTDCNPCIAFLPKMLKLQEQFGDRLKIILYTGDNVDTYKKLWITFKKIFPPKVFNAAAHLPTILADTTLRRMFPTDTYGLNVWIDSNHIYKASKFDHPTEESILAFLNGKSIKSDKIVLPDLRQAKLWFAKRIGFNEHLLNYSFFTKFDEKFRSNGAFYDGQFERDSISGRIVGFQMINVRALELYAMAYFQKPIRDSKFLFEVKNPQQYYAPEIVDKEHFDNWRDLHKFCYAIRIDPLRNEDVFTVMKEDLDNFFHLQSKLEKKRRKCLVLKSLRGIGGIHSKAISNQGTIDILIEDNDKKKLAIRNLPASILAQQIVQDYTEFSSPSAIPVINEVDSGENIDLDMPWGEDHFSIPILRKHLNKYGFDLTEEYRDIETIVLKESAKLLANSAGLRKGL